MISTITVENNNGWWVQKWDVESASRPNVTYRVAKNKRGGYGCTCPHWKYRRKICRHIKLIRHSINDTAELPEALPPAKQPVKPLRAVVSGQQVWVAVRNIEGKAVRIKVEVITVINNLVMVLSQRTQRVYEVPFGLVFERRPDKTVLAHLEPTSIGEQS